MRRKQVAAQQGNMELGTPPMELPYPADAKRVVALPVEGVLNPNNCESERMRSAERGGSNGFAGGGGAEPQ